MTTHDVGQCNVEEHAGGNDEDPLLGAVCRLGHGYSDVESNEGRRGGQQLKERHLEWRPARR